jgi:hypothetical protein
MRRIIGVAAALIGLALVAACEPAPPLGTLVQQTPQTPTLPIIGDPSVLPVGSTYYVFGSSTDKLHVPVRRVTDLSQSLSVSQWDAVTSEALPTRPSWAATDVVWAPTVRQLGNTYVMFFAANRIGARDPANPQCIGRATATNPQGPYVSEAQPFSCGLDGYRGALDPELFVAPTGDVYLYAAFSDTESPLNVIALDHAGDAPRTGALGLAGYWPLPVLGKHFAWEGRFIENPSMMFDSATNTYLLSYSAGDWWTPGYTTGLARCSTPVGLCNSNPAGPWLASGNGRTGTGGLSFFTAFDGTTKAIYASFTAGHEGTTQWRAGSVVTVVGGNAPALTR